MLLVFYIRQYFNTSFHHNSDKSGIKVADCTVESAEYWCLYGTKQELELMYTKIVHLYFALLRTVLMLHVHVSMHCTCAQQAFKLKWSKLPMRRKTQSLFTKF